MNVNYVNTIRAYLQIPMLNLNGCKWQMLIFKGQLMDFADV